jgi:hypothetical protein
MNVGRCKTDTFLPHVSLPLSGRRSQDAAGRNALGDPDRWVQHLGFDDRVVASSGFGDSDIDVFFYGLSPTEATAKLEALGAHLKSVSTVLLGFRVWGYIPVSAGY